MLEIILKMPQAPNDAYLVTYRKGWCSYGKGKRPLARNGLMIC